MNNPSLTEEQVKGLWDFASLYMDWGDGTTSLCQENDYTLDYVLEQMRSNGVLVYLDDYDSKYFTLEDVLIMLGGLNADTDNPFYAKAIKTVMGAADKFLSAKDVATQEELRVLYNRAYELYPQFAPDFSEDELNFEEIAKRFAAKFSDNAELEERELWQETFDEYIAEYV